MTRSKRKSTPVSPVEPVSAPQPEPVLPTVEQLTEALRQRDALLRAVAADLDQLRLFILRVVT